MVLSPPVAFDAAEALRTACSKATEARAMAQQAMARVRHQRHSGFGHFLFNDFKQAYLSFQSPFQLSLMALACCRSVAHM